MTETLSTDLLQGYMARRMLVEDAQWVADSFLSVDTAGPASDILPMLFLGHSARITYEGSRMMRSSNTNVGVPSLAELLPDEQSGTLARARHATKLLDDNKKTLQILRSEASRYWALHRAVFTGHAPPSLEQMETDLGLYLLDGYLVGATIPLQLRFGISDIAPGPELGTAIHDAAREQGSALAVFAAMSGRADTLRSTLDLSETKTIQSDDHDADRYLAGRYGTSIDIEAKLLLLMIESESSTAARILPLTAPGHEESVFRAQVVSVFHSLSSIRKILEAYPAADSTMMVAVRAFVMSPLVRALLENPHAKRIRNRCMHYEMLRDTVEVIPEAPMGAIVEGLHPPHTFDSFRTVVEEAAHATAQILRDWRTAND